MMLTLLFAKACQKNNLTKARNHRHTHHEVNNKDSDSESDSDCGYEGGLTDPSDDEYAYTDSEEDWSDDKSLAELEGDELEASLSGLNLGMLLMHFAKNLIPPLILMTSLFRQYNLFGRHKCMFMHEG